VSFNVWRRLHLGASGTIGLLGVVHMLLTTVSYSSWSADSLWFFATGLSLVLLGGMNWAHIGYGPCQQPTARAVRYANVVYALFGIAAVVAVPEPQAFILAACFLVQAVAGRATLLG
jgi:uncharacterized membrane protein YuzA (DUF378 family)